MITVTDNSEKYPLGLAMPSKQKTEAQEKKQTI